jgi:hypothetical protein
MLTRSLRMTPPCLLSRCSSHCLSRRRLGRGAGAVFPLLLAGLASPVGANPVVVPLVEPTAAPLAAPTASPWAGSLELYGFVPFRSQGTIDVGLRSTEFDADLDTVLDHLQFAASARGSVEYQRLGFQSDLYWVSLGGYAARSGPRGFSQVSADVDTSIGIYDFALRYRFGDRESALGQPGDFSVIPYAGVRLIDADLNVSTDLQLFRFQRSRDRRLDGTWVQALLGTQASVFVAPRLRLFGRADVGGFGTDGATNLSGNAQVGLGYAIGNTTDLNVSWRYLGISLDNGQGGRDDRGYTTVQNGVELGLKFFF